MKVATRHWTRLAGGRVRCDVCPRLCRLREGQRGFCAVRAAEGGEIVLTTWGRSSGFCVDPIEKKPLHHFLPGTPVLSFGTAGCNLACKFCQNWEISTARETEALADEAPPGLIAETAVRLDCRSVAFTYNDPIVFLEYAADTARACHARGLRTVAVTSGYVRPAARADLFEHVDAANVDLKAFHEEFYARITGGHLAPVLDTLRWLVHETDVWVEVTALLIPGLNDSDAELDRMTRWVAEELGPHVPLHFSAFFPTWKLLDRPPTPPSTLTRARGIALRNGLRYAYTGNVHDLEGGETLCHVCGAMLVVRDGYDILGWNLDARGRCGACGTPCAGVFEAEPGRWGARRMPVRLGGRLPGDAA